MVIIIIQSSEMEPDTNPFGIEEGSFASFPKHHVGIFGYRER
jgi:hypothetical protein